MSNEYVSIEDYRQVCADRDEFQQIIQGQRVELNRLRRKVDAVREMWAEEKWLQFSMSALHQIRDRVLAAVGDE